MSRAPVVVGVAAVLTASAWIAWDDPFRWRAPGPAVYQGWVEADTVFVGAEDGGRLASLSVAEGQEVKAGDPLFSIDSKTQTADVQAARQALDEAASRLARLVAAQQRPEEIAILEAALQRAQASLDYSKSELARAQELVRKGFATQARADQAQSTFDQNQAAVEEVQRQIAAARLGGRQEDLEAASFVVGQAKARLASAQAKLDRLAVPAPEGGRILEVYYRPGEVVPVGRPVVALLPPPNMKVRFFVPQQVLPRLGIGQSVDVRCDGCGPGLTASITYLGQEAEYTPPVIYSLEERRKLVYRVEARPGKPQALRVGQPVQVTPAAMAGGAGGPG
jgi:HlyD family secretion protein